MISVVSMKVDYQLMLFKVSFTQEVSKTQKWEASYIVGCVAFHVFIMLAPLTILLFIILYFIQNGLTCVQFSCILCQYSNYRLSSVYKDEKEMG